VKTHLKVLAIAAAFGLAAYALMQVIDRLLRHFGIAPV
jgi:hypothetical protein